MPDAEGYEPVARPTNRPFVPELAARKKIGAGDDWKLYAVKHIDDDITLVEGAVPLGVRKNGLPKWPPVKDCQKVYVTMQQRDEVARAYEASTGRCVECGGDGFVFNGWHYEKGFKYRDCTKCGATGKAGVA